MRYSSSTSSQILSFFQQQGQLNQQTIDNLEQQAQAQNLSALDILLQQKPQLAATIAQLTSKISQTNYQAITVDQIKTSEIIEDIASLQTHSGETFLGVLDPLSVPTERRAALCVIDYSLWQELNKKTKQISPVPEESVQKNEAGDEEPEEISEMKSGDWELIDGDANEQLDHILGGAIDMDASDIHIDLDEVDHKLVSRIRFRIDGQCRDMVVDPRKSIYESIVSRLKTLSFCRLDESRVPQDGRIPFVHKGKNYEFRISFNPVTKKNEQLEKVVLRQMADVSKCNLNMLGIHPYNQVFFREAIALPYGFNIVTGPTGSGKTTTLYSVLQEIDRSVKNVCSIEEPIEAEVNRVNQTQVRHDIGLDFSRVLRALLRQDPDVIMVGEMRDLETAETALDAALTGHVVWSTLHTNSAVASISRLIQMGIKDYMAANALAYVVAQRLTQRVCSECKIPHPEADRLRDEVIIPAFAEACDAVQAELEKSLANASIYKAVKDDNPCQKCDGRGYKGRVGVMEVLKMNDNMRDIIIREQGNELMLQKEAVESGMMTMEQYGYLKVLAGETTVESILSVIVSH